MMALTILDNPSTESIAQRGIGATGPFRWAGDFEHKDFYKTIPKDFVANLKYRRAILDLAQNDKQVQGELWKRCARDLLFYVNTFVWVYEPRIPAVLPCVTYPFQDEALLAIDEAIGKHDLSIKKSRDMTASWDCIIVFEHRWHFHKMHSFLIVSRNQDLVDKADDPDSLFWKLEWMIGKLPAWLQPTFTKTELRLKNENNGSTINGASTTGNVGRGGRRTAVMLDEFAAFPTEDSYRALYATQPVTKSRIFNSTPQGSSNAYYDVAHDDNMKHLELWWPLHPEKSRGLYTARKGELAILDKDYKFPEDYEFVLDGKIRSPYYDQECKRTPVPKLIAQELDMDFLGSSFQFFQKDMLAVHEVLYIKPPWQEGDLEFDRGTSVPKKFVPHPTGNRLKLWFQCDADGKPARDRDYVIGADISAGTGSSNSCLCVGDVQLGAQVAEFTTPNISPEKLADYAVALGNWFTDEHEQHVPLIIGEANGGHNRKFQNRLIELRYGNIFFRRNEQSLSGKVSDVPGWAATPENKEVVFRDLSGAMGQGDFMLRSADCLADCREILYMPDRKIAHAKSRSTIDPTGARENHGDRATAAAICWHGMKRLSVQPVGEPEVPFECMEGRRLAREREKETVEVW